MKYVVCLKHFSSGIRGAPETNHRVEKRSSKGICCAPETIHEEKRSSSGLFLPCLEKLIAHYSRETTHEVKLKIRGAVKNSSMTQ